MANTLITALCCSCVVLSGLFVTSVQGRFHTSSEGDDGARVASFKVSASYIGEAASPIFTLTEDEATATYPFSVTSESEVTVSYDVILTAPSELPEGLTLLVDERSASATEGTTYIFRKVGTIDPNTDGKTNAHQLKITATNFSNAAILDGFQVRVIISQDD